jgi:hypothetical protein
MMAICARLNATTFHGCSSTPRGIKEGEKKNSRGDHVIEKKNDEGAVAEYMLVSHRGVDLVQEML